MRKGEARHIKQRYGLLPTDLSKEVLRRLSMGELNFLDRFPPAQSNKLMRLRDRYLEIRAQLADQPGPRNLPYYLLIKEAYPEFNWVECPTQIQIESYFKGFKPSLLSYLLGIVPKDEVATSARVSRLTTKGVQVSVVERCLEVLYAEGACRLDAADLHRLGLWLAKGIRGERLTLVSPVCPDYACTPGESRQYRFTFEGVGSGVGLAAARLFESLPALLALWVDELGLPIVQHHVLLGDFEAFSTKNCERVGLTQAEFLDRLEGSCKSIDAVAGQTVQSGLFCMLCGGEEGWLREYAEMKRRLEAGEFGILEERIKASEIAKARTRLYQRWYPDVVSKAEFFESLVVAQGLEYAAMGKVIVESFENPLVLAADHQRMGAFYNLAVDLPVIYLDRNYE